MCSETDNIKNIVEVKGLKHYFPIAQGVFFKRARGYVKAVDDVNFSIPEGTTLGLVGESGSGKSTTGNMILRLLKPTEGSVFFKGKDITNLSAPDEKNFRRLAQMVFQNPFASLNPRMIVRDIVGRVLKIQDPYMGRSEISDRVYAILQEVGLKKEHMGRYPHEFSGGQRQRIAIARALVSTPEFLVLDEPTSALDVSVQAQILNFFKELQRRRKITYLFISHNLAVVRHVSHTVAVMYLGCLAELASKERLFASPLHPYTRALLHSVPKPYMSGEDIFDKVIRGDIPSPVNPPPGCRFNTRCDFAEERCRKEMPIWREAKRGHFVACHFVS
ncbi:MAG: ATP-binding cassette domain-containing protein [Synergistaceae bacterium]|jgi:oligopeptide/dipeptide ABC transporter ATP-binding protein|nr:ATP-binding cassette domain-containing protein [Synergistaceae bacterium]